ncbi:uncharacterized protein [Periplaneta americana]|uniref:uncharacterized protein n=1 Tax=Periplaneta americana TaxID=6978 RepID=UPI0037E87B57
MNTHILVALSLVCLALATSVLSLPTGTGEENTLGAEDLSAPVTNELSTGGELNFTENPDEPVVPDDEDMETAEVLVFRPLFRYRHDKVERRRNQARRQRYPEYPYYPYYYYPTRQ